MFLHKSNFLFRWAYPDFIWRMPQDEKKIYLTFDDGPIPDITEFVIETLAQYQAKATFFCIGDNIQKHPNVFQQILGQGHRVGNHTFNHLNGWQTANETYWENTEKCQVIINQYLDNEGGEMLFRPPYGRIARSQAQVICEKYEVVMWDVLTGDFSTAISPETVLRKTIQYTESGSIVVFHDSHKAARNMQFVLPRMLEFFANKGFEFVALA